MIHKIFIALLITSVLSDCPNDCYQTAKDQHHLRGLSGSEIEQISNILNSKNNLQEVFRNINLVRPIGSENHGKVREYVKVFLKKLGWQVGEDQFVSETVIGKVRFTNLVASHNSTKSRRLILACHYESLNKPNFQGSIDSAVPCSMMLTIADLLTPMLAQINLDVTLQLVFFDGEEAFRSWSDDDSLYGSRHLAELWQKQTDKCGCSMLKSIDSLILMDLIGAHGTSFVNFQYNHDKLYDSLYRAEQRISFQQKLSKSHKSYVTLRSTSGIVQDDHIPFMKRNVPVVHLIPMPFPAQWHKVSDNADNVDWDSVRDMQLIMSVFLTEYFHLPLPAAATNG